LSPFDDRLAEGGLAVDRIVMLIEAARHVRQPSLVELLVWSRAALLYCRSRAL